MNRSLYNDKEEWAKAMRLYSYVLIGLFLLALLVVTVRGQMLHRAYPRNTLLFDPSIRFTDFTLYGTRFESLHRGGAFYFTGSWVFSYFPAATFAFWPFFAAAGWNTNIALLIYLSVACIGIVCLMTLVLLALRRVSATKPTTFAWVLTCLLSYPLLVTFDRANIEMIVLFALAGGIYSFVRERYTSAAVLIGCAAAMKLVPLILILLLVQRKRMRAAALLVIVFTGLNIAALLLISSDLSVSTRGWLSEMAILKSDYIVRYIANEIGFEHSAFSCLKQLTRLLLPPEERTAVISRLYPFYVITAGAFFTSIYFFRLRHLPVLNNVFALIICQLILPPFSADYKLLHLYIPFTLFLLYFQTTRRGQPLIQRVKPTLILLPCAVAFTPQTYFIIRSISFGGQIKCISLAFLLLVVVRAPMFTALDDIGDLSGPLFPESNSCLAT